MSSISSSESQSACFIHAATNKDHEKDKFNIIERLPILNEFPNEPRFL